VHGLGEPDPGEAVTLPTPWLQISSVDEAITSGDAVVMNDVSDTEPNAVPQAEAVKK
jgi:hypothetical protein